MKSESETAEQSFVREWPLAKLDDLVTSHSGFWGGDEASEETTPFTVLTTGNVTNSGELDLSSLAIRHLFPWERDSVAEEGDLLVVKSSGSAANIRSGKTAICPAELSGKIACSNFMIRLKPRRDRVDPYLLWRILNSNHAKKFVRKIAGASTYPNIKWQNFKQYEFPLPPIEHQLRIAANLREQMAEVGKARAAFNAQLGATKRLATAHLREIFSSAEAQKWPHEEIVKACRLLPSKSIALSGDVEVRAITSACLTETGFDPAGVKTGRMWSSDAQESRTSSGEILIARSNTPELVGRVAIYQGDPPGVVASDLTIRLLPTANMHGEFLAYYLSFLYTTGYWREKAGGASGTMKKITRSQIEAERIPLPRVEVQRSIANRIKTQLTAAATLLDHHISKLETLDRIPAALLLEAFSRKS